MTRVLKGTEVSKPIKEDIKIRVEKLKSKGITPHLATIRLGENAGDISYEKSIIKACESVGIQPKPQVVSNSIITEELVELIERLNDDKDISGILLFRPLPKHIDENKVRSAISVEKDIDCMHPLNLERIFEGDLSGFAPCTPKAAKEMLVYTGIELEGKDIVIVNRSMVVGKPLAMMLLEKNATVTICHSRTKDLANKTRAADIVITALGKPKFFSEEYFNEKTMIIDVGVSMTEDNKLSGDADFYTLQSKVSLITPAVGGVGLVTTAILLEHTIKSAEQRLKS